MAVTTCTDRKRFPVPRELDASGLPAGTQPEVARAWRKRVRSAATAGAAAEVYCGRSFQEAKHAAHAARAKLLIISGGLGLIRADEAIPSYSLSLVRQSSEFVGSRVHGNSFDPAQWWGAIQSGAKSAPLAEAIRTNCDAIAVTLVISSCFNS